MRTVAAFLITGLCLLAGMPVNAAETPAGKFVLNIESQPVRTALKQLSNQSGVQVLLRVDNIAVDGLMSPKVSGELTVRAALDKLLANTGLSYEFVGERAVAIRSAKADRSSSAGFGEPSDQMRLAQVRDAEEVAQQPESEGQMQQVVVEGQRDRPPAFSTANLDLTRTEDDALPFQVFDAKDIELSGAADLREFLQNRLTQNFSADVLDELDASVTGRIPGQESSPTGALNSRIELRGWDADETVILLNGRRLGAQYQSTFLDSDNASPDLRGIPLSSIERIEILSSAGSAIYGANATGGVINIITRRDFRGGQLALYYETPADTHAPKRGLNLTLGFPLKGGVGLRLGAYHSETLPLMAADRAEWTIQRWRRLALERQPSSLINMQANNPFLTSSQVYGATPNIRATSTSGNLFSTLPGAQASNYTTVPAGSTGNSPLSAFQPGVYSLELAEGAAGDALYATQSRLGPESSNTTLSIAIDKAFGDGWLWSLEYRHTRNECEGHSSGALEFRNTNINSFRTIVPASAPTNPFGQNVRVYLVDPNLDRPELRNRAHNETWYLTSTLRGTVGRWRGYVDLSYSDNRNNYVQNSFFEPDGGWNAAFMSGAYNPFVDPRVRSPADPAFYDRYIALRDFSWSATRNYQSTIKISGPAWQLPAGNVQVTAGLDWSRTNRYRSISYGEYQDGMTGQPRVPVGSASEVSSPVDANAFRFFTFDSYSIYAESTLPLLSARQGVPLAKRLELFGSGRIDRTLRQGFRSQSAQDQQSGVPPVPVKYSNTSSLYVFGVTYEMMSGMAFRASRSIGFKPPSVTQITPTEGPPSSTISGLNDPVRKETFALTPDMYAQRGNPDVRPETTESTNIGLIMAPPGLDGLRLSLDYVENIRDDAIFGLQARDAIMLEEELPGVVTRGPYDGHASGVGPIAFVDLRYRNFRQISSKSADLSVEQQIPNVFGGRLTLSLAASKNLSYRIQISTTAPAVEQIRNVSSPFSSYQIEWNANGQLRWTGARWGFGWSVRYFDYVLAEMDDRILQGGDRAPWALNHDLNVSYSAPAVSDPRGAQWFFSGTSLVLGVKNVFNREPRFWAASTERGVAPYDSIMGPQHLAAAWKIV